jgi:hypothetical protein
VAQRAFQGVRTMVDNVAVSEQPDIAAAIALNTDIMS